MGIRFTCGHCGHQLHVKMNLAGKRGICPKCQGRIDIPADAHAMAHAPQGAEAASSGEIHMTPTAKGRTPAPSAGAGNDLPVATAAGVSQTPIQQPVMAPVAAPLASVAAQDPIAAAPHLAWYVVHAGSTTQYGPAPGAMFRAWVDEGRVSPDSMVWRQDWLEWQRAADVLPQLAARGSATGYGLPTATVAAASSWPGGSGSGPVASAPAASLRKRMTSNTVIAILLTAVLALVPVVWLVLRR
jgi:hypothetical protein